MKTKIKKLTTITLSLFMVLAVFLTATHAKDIMSAQPVKTKARAVETQATRTFDDPVQKSVSDLHNHSDKTMLKNFAKSMGDTPTLSTKRNEKNDQRVEDQPLSVRLLEAFLMMQLAYAYSRA
jgi:hypothetical protein